MIKKIEKQNPAEEAPPIFKSWNRLYAFVFGHLVLLIIAFYIFTRIFR
ncbi:MAG: hypothetical protein ACE5HS_02860 [bacterium]